MRRSIGKKQGSYAGVDYKRATARNFVFGKATERGRGQDLIYVNKRTGAVTRLFQK